MSTTTGQDGFKAIQLEQLQISNTGSQAERRAHFNKAAMAELASSIKEHGVLIPIICRPVDGHFEVVAGERRYLAAKTAGLTAVTCDVRSLTDQQVLEIQLIENLQREGLHELAEAEGYEGLVKLGHSAAAIADKVGKSKAYVYARMKLLALCSDARKGFYGGKLSASTALLLARIPGEELQKQAFKEITEEHPYRGSMSVRDATSHIHENYMLRLDSAGFPTEDATLVAAAGACGVCPKRTGNQPELFGDIKRADVCTDPVCFRAKRDAQAARLAADGATIIQGKKAEKIINGGRLSYGSDFVELSDRPHEDPKNRTAAQLLGKGYEPTLIQDPESGKILKVAKKADLAAALKDAGVKNDRPSNPVSAQEKKAKAERKFREALFVKMRESYPAALAREDWNALAAAMVHEMQHETCKRLFALWGWEPKKQQYGSDYRGAAAGYVAKLSGPDMARFFFDCIFVSDLAVSTWSDSKPEVLIAGAKRFKVNAEQVRRQMNAAQIPKAKKKAGTKK
jgi:ParB/RepB/Spo0J family partition protein